MKFIQNKTNNSLHSLISSSSKSETGFTLMEIMIVITIVTILVVAAVPNFRGFYAETVQNDAARRVATVLKTAQHQAVLHRVQMQVQFDMEKQTYQIIPDPELVPDPDELPKYARIHQLPDGVIFKKIDFNTDDTGDVNNKLELINFYANGSSDGGDIVITGTKLEKTIDITIKKTTGIVVVHEESGETEAPSPQTNVSNNY